MKKAFLVDPILAIVLAIILLAITLVITALAKIDIHTFDREFNCIRNLSMGNYEIYQYRQGECCLTIVEGKTIKYYCASS